MIGPRRRACRTLLPACFGIGKTEATRRKRGMGVQISQENRDDWWEVPGRTALSSYRLRDDADPIAELCLVARDNDGILAGAVRHWPIRVGDAEALLLGPIAVHPTRQGEGLGGMLMLEALVAAAGLGWKRMMLIGDAPYYSRFGFAIAKGVLFPPPTNPDRILSRALVPGGLDGFEGTARPWS